MSEMLPRQLAVVRLLTIRGISSIQFYIMGRLYMAPCRQCSLVEELEASQPNVVSMVVARMITAGIVQKSERQQMFRKDKRKYDTGRVLSLTPLGVRTYIQLQIDICKPSPGMKINPKWQVMSGKLGRDFLAKEESKLAELKTSEL